MSDEQRAAGAQTDEERARAVREQLKSLRAFDLAYEMMISLVTFGYQKMGLTDETSELRDLDDARLAIELLRATLEVVEREQGPERARDVRSTLAQMQLGYAQAVHLAGETPAVRPRAAAPAEAPAAEEPKPTAPAVENQPVDEPQAEAAPRKSAAAQGAAAKKAAPKKPVAKGPAAKKPAAKKPAPKKPAAKKPRGGATPPSG
jgi:hypothetical protein